MWKIRVTLWTGLLSVIFFLFYRAVVPFGEITYVQDFSDENFFIRKFTPADRVEWAPGSPLAVKGEPVYFSLRTPRTFDRARLSVKFRNPDGLPVVEAGVLADKMLKRYELKPLSNLAVDRLSLVWDNIREGDSLLLQKERRYASVAELLADPPAPEKLAVYNYDWQGDVRLSGYASSTKDRDLGLALAGAYRIFAYIKDEPLYFEFVFRDRNRDQDQDPVSLDLYYRGEQIDRQESAESSREEKGVATVPVPVKIDLAGLPEGVYELDVRASGDIITERLRTRQNKLVFAGRLDLPETGKEGIRLYTDARTVKAVAGRPEALQKIRLGTAELDINETYRQFEGAVAKATSSDPVALVAIPKGGLVIAGDGYFAPAPADYFLPRPRELDQDLDPAASPVEYVLAAYAGPAVEDGWQLASAGFDLKSAYRENGQYGFVISVPGLKADDGTDDRVEIGELRVELAGKSLFAKVVEIFNAKIKSQNAK